MPNELLGYWFDQLSFLNFNHVTVTVIKCHAF